jgi:hypothetical protein
MQNTEGKSKVSGFFKFNQGADLKNSITHSSALFMIFDSEINGVETEIHFLNYWKIKRNIASLRGSITLRGLDGGVITSEDFNVLELKAYTIKIRPRLEALGLREFTGTVELEFFSAENLFIPYPAAIVRYVGKNWHTGMHSTARYYYENSGDSTERISHRQEAVESNITLFSEPDIRNSVILHNGSSQSLNESVTLTVTNFLGEQLRVILPSIKMGSLETVVLCVDNHVKYKSFLKGKRGMLQVEYVTKGVFPRIMFMNQHSTGEFSVEHSNFGFSQNAELDCFPASNSDRNLLYSLPVMPDKFTTEIDIFPTFPITPIPYCIRLTSTDFNGRQLSLEEINLDLKGSTYLQHSCKASKQAKVLEIDYINADKLPNRFHTSINYAFKDSVLPGIILDGPFPKTASPFRTRWAPFFWNRDTINTRIFLCSRFFDLGAGNELVTVHFQLFGERESEALAFEQKITARESIDLNMREILSGNGWKSSVGWIYITFSPSSFFSVFYVSDMADGSIMCGHAF